MSYPFFAPSPAQAADLASRPEVVRLHEALTRELFGIREYLTVFAQIARREDQESRDLMNAAAGGAFVLIAVALWREILFGVARMCDPATQGKFVNCSFPHLVKLIDADGRTDLATELGARVEAELVGPYKALGLDELRNKRLAHNDHVTKLEELLGPSPLGGPTMRQTFELMKSQRQILARTSEDYGLGHFDHGRGGYEDSHLGNLVPTIGRDIDHLINCLKEGRTPPLSNLGLDF